MKKELGSEFWNVPLSDKTNSIFPEETQWYISGRSALKAIISELPECKSVAMPSWCCDSMLKPFCDAGIEIRFYPVFQNSEFRPRLRFDCDALFLMDYFGYSSDPVSTEGYSGVIIRDITHSLFSKSYADADYYFGSLRKWCGIWTGGYAWAQDGHGLCISGSKDSHYSQTRSMAMLLKQRYLAESFSIESQRIKNEYLKLFSDAEEYLDSIDILPGETRDAFAAKHLDVSLIRTKRSANAKILQDAFTDLLIFKNTSEKDCPMFVPILVPHGNRNRLRQFLIQNNIYCPVHWPVSSYHDLSENDRPLYEEELSIICDQRYDEPDMHKISELIKHFFRETQ